MVLQNYIDKKTYYYVDNKCCLRSACVVDILVITNPSEFVGSASMSVNYGYNLSNQTEIDVGALDPSTSLSLCEGIKEQVESATGRGYYVYIASIPADSVFTDACAVYSFKKYAGFSLKDYPESTIFEQDIRCICAYMSMGYGQCRGKGLDKSNIEGDTVGAGQPVYPVIMHNCRLCGLCFDMCKHANAIKNSITQTRHKIEQIPDLDYNRFIDVARSNQQSKLGEEIFP